MIEKPKVGILTNFQGADMGYSLVVVVRSHLQMLIKADYAPVLFVSPAFHGEGVFSDKIVEIRKHVAPDADQAKIKNTLSEMIGDIDVMLCHDLLFLSQNNEWAKALRKLAEEYPHIAWLHFQHSRGDHEPIVPMDHSWFCYPNKGDLNHVAQINSTTLDKVYYIPHPLDIDYLAWPDLAVRIAEDFSFPFVDVSSVMPARLDRQKQIEKIVRIFAGFKRAGKSVCLLIADAYATGERFLEYKRECLALAKEQGLNEKEFAFLGETYDECRISTPHETVKALLEMSSIFIQPSTAETSSLVVMEAALAGNLVVVNSDFPPIQHLYKKALSLPFGSIFHEDRKYWREYTTADGEHVRVPDDQKYWDDQVKELLIPVLDGQLTLAVKRQQFADRWPSRVFANHLEPLLLKAWEELRPKECKFVHGDSEVTCIITTMDNLPILKRQIPMMIAECGKVIVVDQDSKDGTREWLDKWSNDYLTVIHKENDGAGPGRNRGLDEWNSSTPYVLMLDGGILPLLGSVKAMKEYLLCNPDVQVISPEIFSCFVTDEHLADKRMEIVDESSTFSQRCLSSTAYALCRSSAWEGLRFSEEGPFGKKGWGTDDNEMQCRWNKAGVVHKDFNGVNVYRHSSGSFKRLLEETGVYPNQYGSVHEQRNVKLWQDYPEYFDPLWNRGTIKVSCIVLGWNEYPMIARAVKTIHDDLKDIPHEVIVVNNGSTDGTAKWLDDVALRWHHGDTYIDSVTGEIVKRTEENEISWTGNVIRVDLPENMGTGRGLNEGFARARGEYIFFTAGDILHTPGTLQAFVKRLDEHKDEDYICFNAWCCQKENEHPVFDGLDQYPRLGLGNYAYAYAMMRRAIWDSGVRFADWGPFAGAGTGYDECEFAWKMAENGFKAYTWSSHAYFHDMRAWRRAGYSDPEEQTKKVKERMDYLKTRWVGADYQITHYHDQPPARHVRNVAIMYHPAADPGQLGVGGFFERALGKICNVTHFIPGEESEGFDEYLYIDDSPTYYNEPKFHPATYYAIDMVLEEHWFLNSAAQYLERLRNFDHGLVSSKVAQDYCAQNGLTVKLIPFAADPDFHKPYETERVLDWIALWHNCGDRMEASAQAINRFPNGKLAWIGGERYAEEISRARCVLNWLRSGDLVNMRVYEAMAIGTPLVTSRSKQMDHCGFEENTHYLGFEGIEEMLEKIAWANEHPVEALEMAARARELVLKKHLYYHRVLEIFA